MIDAGHRPIPEAPLGALHPRWMHAVASRDLAVIARDRHIRTNPAEREILRQHGLLVFCIAGKNDLATWDIVRVMRFWGAIEESLNQGAGRWFVAIDEAGFRSTAV